MLQKNSRQLALKLLKQCHGDIPLPELLQEAFSQSDLDVRDKALCTELVYGTLRHLGRLKFVLASYLKKPETLPPHCLNILLLGSYEMLFLNIPSHATVNEYVGMAKKLFGKNLSSLCNAVLRSLERNKEEVLAKDISLIEALEKNPHNEQLLYISGLAPWFLRSMTQEKAYEPIKIIAQLLEAPVPSYRINTRAQDLAKTQSLTNVLFSEEENALISNSTVESLGIICPEITPIVQNMEAKGLLSRQGLASQELIRILHQILLEHDNPVLWDACCGRGGKSCGLLERGIKVSHASDPNAQRLEDFIQALERLQLPKPILMQGTVQELCSLGKLPDKISGKISCKVLDKWAAILLDVPCTGSGTLGRNPELRLRITEEKMHHSVAQQKDILEHAWRALQDKGLLIYATCSVFPEENTMQIENFTQAHNDAEIIQQSYIIPKYTGHDVLFYAILQKK